MSLRRITRAGLVLLASTLAGLPADASAQSASQTLTISAAASLRDAITDLGHRFEQRNKDVRVRFNFASSSQLASQIEQGAPVDVFAAADIADIERLAAMGIVTDQRVLAENQLAIITWRGTGGRIAEMGDLARKGLRLANTQAKVPIARYTQEVLARAGTPTGLGAQYQASVMANMVSEEPDVRMLVMKTALGEIDGAFVYRTDIRGDAVDKLKIIEIPPQYNVTTQAGIGLVKRPVKTPLAREFIEFAVSEDASEALSRHGFRPIHKRAP